MANPRILWLFCPYPTNNYSDFINFNVMVRANGKNKKERKQNRKLCPQSKVCEGLTNPVTLVTAQFWAKQYSKFFWP